MSLNHKLVFVRVHNMKKILLTILLLLISTPGWADITTGLIGWWKFDEGSGTSTTDSSNSGNTGALQNTPTWVKGNIGPYALNFNGSNQYVSASLAVASTPFSVSCWVYVLSYTIGAAAISTGNNTNWFLQIGGTDQWQFEAATSLSAAPIGVWQHLVGTDNGTTAVIYINGVQIGSTAHSFGASTSVNFGRRSDGNYFHGYIDDVRIYNRTLSASDVVQLYSYGLTTVKSFSGYANIN